MGSFREVDLVVIGGGPSGLEAAISSWNEGIRDILLIEREERLGGILNQCIHDGFGLELFKRSMTGPEYAKIYIDRLRECGVRVLTRSMVVELNRKKEILFSNREGVHRVKARAIVLAMGARERPRGAIPIPGTRPSGIFTAGVAQRLINIQNRMVGRDVVILGSGDIGLIMARTLLLEGARVHGVVEILPYPSGLTRNVVQCLDDFGIPLYLSHTVVEIKGERRITSVVIAEVGPKGGVKRGSRKMIDCDTLLLSVGLLPENELSKQAGIRIDETTGGPIVDEDGETSVPGIFACGNVLQIHDLVDYATMEATHIGKAAASYIKGERRIKRYIRTRCAEGIRQVLPHLVSRSKDVVFSIRVKRPGFKRKILIMDEKRVLKEVAFNRVVPSEMIRIKLPKERMEDSQVIEVGME